jgi:hypothetical protein
MQSNKIKTDLLIVKRGPVIPIVNSQSFSLNDEFLVIWRVLNNPGGEFR